VADITPIRALLDQGCDLEADVVPIVAREVPELPRPLRNWGAQWLVREILAARDIVGLEVAMVVTAGTKASKPVARFANPALLTAFAWSAGLNGFAISANQDAVMWKAVAAVLGVSIPILIYLGTRTWAAMTIETRRAVVASGGATCFCRYHSRHRGRRHRRPRRSRRFRDLRRIQG
jgi:hypothetical protein